MLQKLKNALIYGFIYGLLFCARFIPWKLALNLGGFLGALFCAWVPRERNKAIAHLAVAFPNLPLPERYQLARRVFIALGQNALELAKMFAYSTSRIISLVSKVEGRENMQAALAKQRGVICLTAHLGNWEILPIFTHYQGWNTAVVAQSLYDPRLDALLNDFRSRHGILVIKRQQVTRDIIRALRQNMLLGVLNDQDTRVDSRFVDFLGRTAKTPVGIVRLARALGTPIVPVFIRRVSGGRHGITIQPEVPIPRTQNEEQDLVQGAELCNRVIGDAIRRAPEQWVWFHERWKSAPEKEV